MSTEKLLFKNKEDEIFFKEKDGKFFLERHFKNLDESEVNYLLKAAAKIQKIVHPNVSTFSAVLQEAEHYIVQEELPSSMNLQDYIDTYGKMPLSKLKWVISDILKALDFIHPVLLHGDLRPEYIWLDLNIPRAVVAGIGIFNVPGVEYLASPEQLQETSLSEKSDIFNLGSTAYYALTGQKLPNPITVKKGLASFSPPKDVVGLDPMWNNFILKCINFAPNKRFQTIKDVLEFLKIPMEATPQQPQRLVSPESITRKNLLNAKELNK